MSEWVNEWINKSINNVWMNEWMNGWINWIKTYLPLHFGNCHPVKQCVQYPVVLLNISPVSQCPHLHQSTDVRNTYLPVQFGNSHPISHGLQCPVVLSQISPLSQCPHFHQSTDARNTYLYSLVTPILFYTVYNVLWFYHRYLHSHNVHTYTSPQMHGTPTCTVW